MGHILFCMHARVGGSWAFFFFFFLKSLHKRLNSKQGTHNTAQATFFLTAPNLHCDMLFFCDRGTHGSDTCQIPFVVAD